VLNSHAGSVTMFKLSNLLLFYLHTIGGLLREGAALTATLQTCHKLAVCWGMNIRAPAHPRALGLGYICKGARALLPPFALSLPLSSRAYGDIADVPRTCHELAAYPPCSALPFPFNPHIALCHALSLSPCVCVCVCISM
jgi:hypothetical protein